MVETQDRVLLIDRDPEERAALVEAALRPAGYAVEVFGDAVEALARLHSDFPDVIVLDLHLGALSGRDVLVALNARGADVPVILLVDEGAERQALQAFRLGATDYLVRPVREAELVQTVERALKAVRLRRDRETLLEEVRRAARQSERHLRDLSTLMGVGKALTSLRGLDNIFAAVARAAAEVTGAEASGLLLRDEASGRVILRSGHQLPPELAARTGQPVEDSLAALVMSSGETYIGAGEGLRRFNPLHRAASAVIYAPLTVQGTPVGLLWVANEDGPFLPHMADLMTALADYATIAIVNARLLDAMQERTQQLEALARPAAPPTTAERPAAPDTRCEDLIAGLRAPLIDVLNTLNMFRVGQMGPLKQSHRAAVDVLHRKLSEVLAQVDGLAPPASGRPGAASPRRGG